LTLSTTWGREPLPRDLKLNNAIPAGKPQFLRPLVLTLPSAQADAGQASVASDRAHSRYTGRAR
jgi:hypothetical protein